MQETWIRSLGQEESLEKGMATHSSILAWRIPWIKEPGRLQSIGHKESDTTKVTYAHTQSKTSKDICSYHFWKPLTVKKGIKQNKRILNLKGKQ